MISLSYGLVTVSARTLTGKSRSNNEVSLICSVVLPEELEEQGGLPEELEAW
jgi:hypothetical protein